MGKKIGIIQIFLKRIPLKGIRIYGLLLLLVLLTNACIEPYFSDIDKETKLITVEGSLIKGNEEQTLIISNTTTLLYQEFFPVRGCEAKIVDELNNEFFYEENRNGTYIAKIDDNMLVFDRQYKLSITTPEGKVYESEFEILNNNTAVDTVYYSVEDKLESYSGDVLKGVQFYVDIEAADTISRYFRWKLTETYEYTTTGPLSYLYYDPSLSEPVPPDDIWALYRCWMTEDVDDLYMTSTVNLTINEKKRIPLQYVSSRGIKLKIKYSVLVEQYTLSESAYNYWQQKKIASEDPGGLYTRQPSLPVTNIQNINDAGETVLGYFWVSSKTEQRVFIPRIPSVHIIEDECVIRPLDPKIDIYGSFPKYIRVDEDTGIEMTGRPVCFDCTLRGGTTTKPDFWE